MRGYDEEYLVFSLLNFTVRLESLEKSMRNVQQPL